MGFIRRLLGGGDAAERNAAERAAADGDATERQASRAPTGSDDADAAERTYELDLLRGEQERLDDLVQRQLRYADHAWRPPDQGGSRRSDDADADRG